MPRRPALTTPPGRRGPIVANFEFEGTLDNFMNLVWFSDLKFVSVPAAA